MYLESLAATSKGKLKMTQAINWEFPFLRFPSELLGRSFPPKCRVFYPPATKPIGYGGSTSEEI
jgi:hypothetical protein